MNIFRELIIFHLIIYVLAQKSWLPEEIKNPLKNPVFCNSILHGNSLICDPENLMRESIKRELTTDLMFNIPQSSTCFCDRDCQLFDYRKRLMIGIVLISSINLSIKNCTGHQDTYDCFSERVLKMWNISLCDGNNGLILLINSQIHLYFGSAVRRKISGSCIRRLYSTIRPYVPLNFKLRTLFKETIRVIRKPCLCNDTCSFRHLKWLTNIVFFMGVIVLVTCIGGMSRRAMLAKFHHRSFSSRHIFGDYIIRRRPSLVLPRTNESIENCAAEICDDIRPPDYNTLGPLPKPPPYISVSNIGSLKTIDTPLPENSLPHHVHSEDDQPPSYDLVTDDSHSLPPAVTTCSNINQGNHSQSPSSSIFQK